MQTVRWSCTAAFLGLIGATMAAADEEKIAISKLPKVVAKAAKKAFPEAKIVGAAKETEDGETVFEVMMKLDGKSIDLAIDEEGEIEEIEREISIKDLPSAVVKVARKTFAKGKITKVEEVSDEDDKVVYELAIETKSGKTIAVVMSPNGKILEEAAGEEEEDAKKTEMDDDEEDEDDKPKAKKKEMDEDDDKPKAKKKEKDDDEDEDEDKPKAKKKEMDDDEDEDKPKAKKKEKDDDEEDDDDAMQARD